MAADDGVGRKSIKTKAREKAQRETGGDRWSAWGIMCGLYEVV